MLTGQEKFWKLGGVVNLAGINKDMKYLSLFTLKDKI